MLALTPREATRSYRAFVSYSHADTAVARWVQKAIESYRVPRQLRRRHTGVGELPERLYPVYRDRLDMRVGQNLEESIVAALRDSEALVVVCSPDAAGSHWVDLEIRTFIAANPGAPILAIIAGGRPGIGANSCFPKALLERRDAEGALIQGLQEPVAADLRPGGDGRRMARLKLVAGLLDVDLVQLARRDDQRRVRRALIIAVAAVAIAAMLAVLLVQARLARREAEAQRAGAEGLVEFMVGDLRTRLDALGKLSILEAVGGRALRYYQTQNPHELRPDSLARRARVLRLLGEIESEQGNLAAAGANFNAAADSTARLLALAPGDGQRIFDHAQSVYWVGDVARRAHRAAIAEAAFRDYGMLAERLVRIDPANLAWQAEKGYAYSNLGTLLFDQGRNAQAEQAFRGALHISEMAARARPGDPQLQIDLAQSHAWLADALARRGGDDAAIAEREAELAIYRRSLQPGKDSKQTDYATINARVAIARALATLGRRREALDLVAACVGDATALADFDRENAGWADLVAVTTMTQVEMLIDAGRDAEAQRRLDALDRLVPFRPAKPGATTTWRLRRARDELLRSRLLLGSGLPDAALNAARRAATLVDGVVGGATHDVRLLVARTRLQTASALLGLGQRAQAAPILAAILRDTDGYGNDDAEFQQVRGDTSSTIRAMHEAADRQGGQS